MDISIIIAGIVGLLVGGGAGYLSFLDSFYIEIIGPMMDSKNNLHFTLTHIFYASS